jgi:hypothetical protein
MKYLLLFVLLLLTLSSAGLGEEVWVRNKPFEGATEGSGTSLKLELPALLEALSLKVKRDGNSVVFGDFRVPVETSAQGKEMVLLKDFSVGAGLKVTRSKELGTVDIYSTTAGTQGNDEWASLGTDSAGSSGSATSGSGRGFTLSTPPQLELVDDPNIMAALAAQFGGLDKGDLMGVVLPKNQGDEALIMIFKADGLPPVPNVSRELQMEASKGYSSAFESKGARRVSGPTPLQLAGREFIKIQHEMTKNGKTEVAESYLTFDGPRGALWVLMLTGERTHFNRMSPVFQPVIQSFKLN